MLDVNIMRACGSVCAFIRHGEKDDSHQGLTENGKKEIKRFARLLYTLHKPVRLYTSPEHRCIETAAMIGEVLLVPGSNITTSTILGKPGVQVRNEDKYSLLTTRMRCRNIYREWKMGLHWDAMQTPAFIRTEVVRFFHETFLTHGITIYISQSGTIACTGYSLGLTDYVADDKNWVNYLDGFVLRI